MPGELRDEEQHADKAPDDGSNSQETARAWSSSCCQISIISR